MYYKIVTEDEIFEIFKNPELYQNGSYMAILDSEIPYVCVVVKDGNSVRNKWRIKKFAELWLENVQL